MWSHGVKRRVSEENVVAYFNVLSQYLREETKEPREIRLDSPTGVRIESVDPRIRFSYIIPSNIF